MKKTVMVVGLVLLAVSGVFAQVIASGQTVRYNFVAKINKETGVRSNDRKISDWWSLASVMYITFTNNSCYDSDSKGMAIGNRKERLAQDYSFGSFVMDESFNGTYRFQGEQNNLFTFMEEVTTVTIMATYTNPFPSQSTTKSKVYMNFSKDYKVLNIDRGTTVYVYNRDEPKPPEPEKKPDIKLWN